MALSLCYNRVKSSLYKGRDGDSDSIFDAYDKKGWKEQKISIPNENVDIIIHSNHHYAGASYLYAKIIIRDLYVLNFRDEQMLYLLSDANLNTFQVKPEDWDTLFDKIIHEHENLFMISESIIKKYFNELDKIIDGNSISIFRNKADDRPTLWDNNFLVRLHSSDKIVDIIKNVEKSTISNSQFVHKCLYTSCINLTKKIAQELEWDDIKRTYSRLKRLGHNLSLIHKYMDDYGSPLTFEKIMACKEY